MLVLSSTAATFARIGEEEIRNMESSVVINRIDNSDVQVDMPGVVFTFQDVDIKLKFKDPQHPKLLLNNNELSFIINGAEQKIKFDEKGEATFKHKFDKSNAISILCEDLSYENRVSAYPVWIFAVPVAFLGIWVARSRFSKKDKKKEEASRQAA